MKYLLEYFELVVDLLKRGRVSDLECAEDARLTLGHLVERLEARLLLLLDHLELVGEQLLLGLVRAIENVQEASRRLVARHLETSSVRALSS